MSNYKIKYEILNYNKYRKRINDILNNKKNKFKVIKHKNIGKTSSGFDIEHYSIGNGDIHITYLGGAHGNEIISVDYVTQLMNNIALGNGVFECFDTNTFTIDFIPCQNPESFYTTTYALDTIIKDMKDKELENFCKEYYLLYKEDDMKVITLNNIIKNFCEYFKLDNISYKLNLLFWDLYRENILSKNNLIDFFSNYSNIEKNKIKIYVDSMWDKYFNNLDYIDTRKKHLKLFDNVTIDCIPEIDSSHIKLKNKLKKIYSNGKFNYNTLANFFANADGINLNDNNEIYFEKLKNQIKNEGIVYGNLRDNNIIKSIPGPLGLPNINMDLEFNYAIENESLLNYLDKQCNNNIYYALINCHGTGGLIYLYPEENICDEIRDFKYYINNRISTEYRNSIGEIYEKYTGTFSPYKTMDHPKEITGFGDVLRKKYIASFILELSKMGGNPIGPYGDYVGNFNLTMISNMESTIKILDTIKSLEHLYNTKYTTLTYNIKR